MSVTLTSTADRRVAVLHGVDTDAALRHLGRSLLVGAAFDDQRVLVIDLGGCEPSPATVELLREAGRARLRRHQVIAAASNPREVSAAITRACGWIERFDQPGTGARAAIVPGVSSLRAVVGTGISGGGRALIRLARRPWAP